MRLLSSVHHAQRGQLWTLIFKHARRQHSSPSSPTLRHPKASGGLPGLGRCQCPQPTRSSLSSSLVALMLEYSVQIFHRASTFIQLQIISISKHLRPYLHHLHIKYIRYIVLLTYPTVASHVTTVGSNSSRGGCQSR